MKSDPNQDFSIQSIWESMNKNQIKELINRRRKQILIHSCIYYRLNSSIISDHTYDRWCKELADLQMEYPDIATACVYEDSFKNFDGSTGFHLPIHDPYIVGKAVQLLNYHTKKKVNK